MAQAFSQSTVFAIKLFSMAALVLAIGAVTAARWYASPDVKMQEPVEQPIPFSHKHHVGDGGIDCRYCHTSVEKSAFAGMPSTEICLTCHSQLFTDSRVLAPLHASMDSNTPVRWNRVHDLPDFVYFDHSIHVNKGVACVECHGRVDEMPLTARVASLDMQWCLQCHRTAPRHIRPLADVFEMTDVRPLSQQEIGQLNRLFHLQDTRRLTDCSTCHR
ncbi:cytochrome c3 family protein [Paraburkholderia diazotrophica]|uniref:Quinol:cytochrome c oxidoreductase pentaheme cytochrome subunit n=1 Tax=Paraburkholderia diazotrophica TaxID=667676 RepID=A0A1H6WBD1_9BURK|nr:cytochrome c3 family protein [Paraburkholderia diazotrophica]SEJ14341.1 quinol:cytochrome c oxidoreductase pentaheme cytochrome subunit [Paraburkholderia diazotrophica]